MKQLDLSIATIQPDEAFVVHLDVRETWAEMIDVKQYENEEDNCEFGGGTRSTPTTIYNNEQQLVGIVVDDFTYQTLLKRAEPYARRWEADWKERHGKDKVDYKVKAEYTFTKQRRLLIPETNKE